MASLWLAVSCCGASAATTGAQSEFTLRDWQTEDGLPQSSVVSMAQTPDGYLWLATYNGLARFDGVQFTPFDTSNLPGLPGNRLMHLSVDQEGALWVITEYRDAIRLKDGRCKVFTMADGVPAEGARWVHDDGQGGAGWPAITPGSGAGTPATSCLCLFRPDSPTSRFRAW